MNDLEHALETLGMRNEFLEMNRSATSFEQLNASFEAFRENVKKQYRQKAGRLHPDKEYGDVEKMKALNAAYDVFKKLRLQPKVKRPTVIIIRSDFQTSFYGASTVSTTTNFYPSTGGG